MKLFLVFSCLCFNSYACDICGCFMGITPYDNQSQFSIYHRYRVFNGYRNYHQQGSFFPAGAYKVLHSGTGAINSAAKTYSSKDFESYKVYELRAKYFIHNRLELNVILPFNQNKSKEDTITYEHTGIGDASFFAGYHLIKKVDYETFLHRLIVGTGVKLPIGNNYATDINHYRLPFLIQPGTGSVDGFLYANYIFGFKKFGASLNSIYKVNGENYYHERIGNSISNYLNLFYKTKVNNFVFIPSVQAYYENTKGLYINKIKQEGTAMNCLLLGPGLDLYYKNFSLSTAIQFNVYEKTEENNLDCKGRIIVGLTYNFNQRNYLFGKRNGSD